MDSTSLLLSLLFGSIGVGYIMYAKKMGQWVPAGAGLWESVRYRQIET